MSQSRTAVFRYLVHEHMQAPPVVTPPSIAAEEVVGRMSAARASAAVVVDDNDRLVGILTEQDVVRRVACRRLGTMPVEGLMTRLVETIRVDQSL